MSDSQSSYSQYPVHLGSWVNWSRGKVFGATLTMTRDDGNLLIAFTALFVGFVASRFWQIVCFTLHRQFSSPDPKDGLHHQRQVILRNASSAELSAWTMTLLLLAWRRSARRPFIRILPILAGALLCIGGFSVAGGFSSRIATAIGDEVLIAPAQCACQNPVQPSDPQFDLRGLLDAMKSQELIGSDAANYAQQCYQDSGVGVDSGPGVTTIFDCETFAADRLPTTIDQTAACPFPNHTICKTPSNIHLDTGYLDSHVHFGLNSPPQERIVFRQTFTCAPLQTHGYTRQRSTLHYTFTQYLYGGGAWDRASNYKTRRDFTYEVFDMDTQYPNRSEFPGDYLLNSKGSLKYLYSKVSDRTVNDVSQFQPRRELFRPDGDMTIAFFSGNGLLYQKKSTDAWYTATRPCRNISQMPGKSSDSGPQSAQNLQAYCPDEAAAPLGCISQYQFCRPSLPTGGRNCSIVGSFFDAFYDAYPLFDVPVQALENISWITDVLNGGGFSKMAKSFTRFLLYWVEDPDPVGLLGWAGPDLLLLSSQTVYSSIQLESRDDQWKRDVAHWWSIFLARQQISFAQAGTGIPKNLLENSSATHGQYIQLPDDLCGNQKIRSRRHTSFSIFGICFIYVVGGLITIISYVLEPLFICIDKRKDKNNTEKAESSAGAQYYRKDVEWTANDVLHLHCLSNKPLISHQDPDEGLEGGAPARWTKFEDAIPIIQPAGHLMKPLTFEDGENSQQPKERTNKPQKSLNLVDGESRQAENTSPGSEETDLTVTEVDEQGQGQDQDENQSTPAHAIVNHPTENHLEIEIRTPDMTTDGEVEAIRTGPVLAQLHDGNETVAVKNEAEHEHAPQLPALVLGYAGEGGGCQGLSDSISRTEHFTAP